MKSSEEKQLSLKRSTSKKSINTFRPKRHRTLDTSFNPGQVFYTIPDIINPKNVVAVKVNNITLPIKFKRQMWEGEKIVLLDLSVIGKKYPLIFESGGKISLITEEKLI